MESTNDTSVQNNTNNMEKQEIMNVIQTLSNLLSINTPIDDQFGYTENMRWKSAFSEAQLITIKNKIMDFVRKL